MKFLNKNIQDLLPPETDLYFNAIEHEKKQELKHIKQAKETIENYSNEEFAEITLKLGELYDLACDEITLLSRKKELAGFNDSSNLLGLFKQLQHNVNESVRLLANKYEYKVTTKETNRLNY